MTLEFDLHVNLKTAAAKRQIEEALAGGLQEIVTDISADVVAGSPILTGHNRRSISTELKKLSARIFSTSGYGGWLEIGTRRMSARPYFRPALDRHIKKLPDAIKKRLP